MRFRLRSRRHDRELPRGDHLLENDGFGAHNYDVSRDGQRFVMVAPPAREAGEQVWSKVVVVQHWTEELKRLVPTN